jgi:DNA-binding transcriptional MocR family regulator
VAPERLPLSRELVDHLLAWAREYDANLIWDDPASTHWPSPAAHVAWVKEGFRLAQRLADELAGQSAVHYFDDLTSRVESVTAVHGSPE